MKLIAHKGNINGPDPSKENTPEQIEHCVKNGYDVEIDIWYDEDGKLWLGHDKPKHEITWWWLAGLQPFLWIHCKDFKTLTEFVDNTSGYNYFWHQGDDYTLTSKKYIWSSPGKTYSKNTVIVEEDPLALHDYNCYGICSDYVGRMR
jgi:glycerophosphoryl diester phosphodiesterase